MGRVSEADAEWLSKLYDLGMVNVSGTCIVVPHKFHSGRQHNRIVDP